MATILKYVPFGRTELRFDLQKLREELNDLLIHSPFDTITNQISLTHTASCESFYDGVGTLYDEKNKQFKNYERDFRYLNTKLSGTYIENVYHQVQKWSPFPLGRVRFMRLKPKSCLSMHRDSDLRYHIPLYTSEQAYFVIAQGVPFQLPADGSLYWVNTLVHHSVFNGHATDDRIHLVFSTAAQNISDYFDFLSKVGREPLTHTQTEAIQFDKNL